MIKNHWAPHQIDILTECYPNLRSSDLVDVVGHSVSSIYNMARKLGLKKSEAFYASERSGRGNVGNAGGGTRFRKGHQTWSKGMKGLDTGGHETRFKPGNLSGRANENYKPIGTERISKDGYLERKVNDVIPRQKRWRAVHIIVWEQANGPLPAGHAIVFKDGDNRNFDVDNLECISRAELMRRNSVHNYPKEIAELMQLRGALTKKINRRSNKNEPNHQ